MNLGNDKALWLLFAVPVVLLPVYIWCFWQKAKALKILASNEMLKKINISVSLKKQIFKAILLIAGFISIVIAFTEPKWYPQAQKIERQGLDGRVDRRVPHDPLFVDLGVAQGDSEGRGGSH